MKPRSLEFSFQERPAAVAQWLGVALLSTRSRVRLPAAAAAFLMEAKSKNARVYEISAHVKDIQVVKINPEPSTTARLTACVASAR